MILIEMLTFFMTLKLTQDQNIYRKFIFPAVRLSQVKGEDLLLTHHPFFFYFVLAMILIKWNWLVF